MFTDKQWKELLIPYSQAIAELKVKFKFMRNEYREFGVHSPIEFVVGRVKTTSSIMAKAKKKSIPLDKIVRFMDDIAGIRIMCQFVDDIYKVVELLRARDGTDISIIYEKDYVKHAKQSGYRSYHMIILYPVHTAIGAKNVMVEIQIRTLAMNFWATIEHSLNYKYASNIPQDIKMRLKNSAISAAALDNEMIEIKNEIVNAQMMFDAKSGIIEDETMIEFVGDGDYD